jgi:RecJ-like exonuclease
MLTVNTLAAIFTPSEASKYGDAKMAKFTCYKCGGSGRVCFTHIENGVCFTCAGTGELSYQPKQKAWKDPHPEMIVPEATRSTTKQWEFLAKLCNDSDDACRKVLKAAGAPMATQRYVSKSVMSKAIEIAKGVAA